MNASRLVARAPGRVNLIGEHTDYTGGLAMPMAIDRYIGIDAEPADRVRLRSDRFEDVAEFDLGAVVDDVTGWARFVAAVAAEVGGESGIDGTVTSDIPSGGLSSSAALELAVALALGFDGTPRDLARLARRAEHAATGVPTGIMDQLCIATARAGHASLIDCNTLAIEYVPVRADVAVVIEFVAPRTLVGSEYATRHDECLRAEAAIGPLRLATPADADTIADPTLRRRARHVTTENERVGAFAAALAAGDHVTAGEIMADGHRSLRDDFECSTEQMDQAVAGYLATPGVYGARMTGGGFGGCLVAWCDPDAVVTGTRVRPVGAAHRGPAPDVDGSST